MRSRVGHSLFACIAGQFDAREEADGLRVVEGLQAWKELSGTSVACAMDNMRTWANSTTPTLAWSNVYRGEVFHA